MLKRSELSERSGGDQIAIERVEEGQEPDAMNSN
jgi:hypothetical protein